MPKKKKELEADEAKSVVLALAMGIQNKLIRDTRNFKETQRWLVISRAINMVFQHHYALSVSAACEADRKQVEAGNG